MTKDKYDVSEPVACLAGWFCIVLKNSVPAAKFVGKPTAAAARRCAKQWIKEDRE